MKVVPVPTLHRRPGVTGTARLRHTVVAWLPSTDRPTWTQPDPGPVSARSLPAEANSSRVSSAFTAAGTWTEKEVALALRVACPTHEMDVGGGGGGGGGGSSPPSRLTTFSSAHHLQVLVADRTGASLLLSWQTNMPRGYAAPRSAVVAVTPSVWSQSSELTPSETRKVLTNSLAPSRR